MPLNNYLRIVVGDYDAQVTNPSDLPVSIDYSREDPEDFMNKTSSIAIDIEIPATLLNSKKANSYHLPSIEDLTTGQVFRGNQFGMIEANGYQLLVGRSFLKSAKHNWKPISYTYNFLGDNADWIVDLKDRTLYDFVKDIAFIFDKATIENSWSFDGTNILLPYVFAPIRYRRPFADYSVDINGVVQPDDTNFLPVYARPSLSKYWILFKAFKSIGYRIVSDFMDSEYYRRQVMPWTWGNFLDSDGTQLEKHKFLAKSEGDQYFTADRGENGKLDDYVDMEVTNDTHDGGFDNNVTSTTPNGDYTYNASTFEMTWTYNAPDFGPMDARFSITIAYIGAISGSNSDMGVSVEWFRNGVPIKADRIMQQNGQAPVTIRPVGQTDAFLDTSQFPGNTLSVGDTITAKIKVRLYRDKTAINDVTHVSLNVLRFQLDSFRIPLGGLIDFTNFTSAFQNRKFVDFLAGEIDQFNLTINTDPINKIVYIEPLHPYSITSDLTVIIDGYMKNDFVNWNGKEDLSQTWEMENYSDVERELVFKYKDDSQDGILKKIQDRQFAILGSGKYIFPERFQTGSKNHENRFFSPTMHYDVVQWKDIGTGINTGVTPQMVCIVPENISQTSASESDNTFEPKSCYYKGNVTGAGAWRWDGDVLQSYPYLFAVNYQTGGENDPIFSYTDELIAGTIGKGLLKRFFWQRLAIDRNGQRYTTFFKLKNIDVANQLHREYKSYGGQRWECVQIKGYAPLVEKSTQVLLYKLSPVSTYERDNTYPSQTSVSTGKPNADPDIKYYQLKCLTSDVPT